MTPWQEIPLTLPLSVPLGFQGSQPLQWWCCPNCHKEKGQEGCLRRAFPEAPPPLTRMKKKKKEEEGDDTNSNVSAGPPDPRPPDDRVGPPPHSLPLEAATNDPVDPISRPETSSAEPNATRR